MKKTIKEPNLRDYFAAKAMQAFMAQPLPEGRAWLKDVVAKDAYLMADVMLEARDPKEND
jgi:hypothetical protein